MNCKSTSSLQLSPKLIIKSLKTLHLTSELTNHASNKFHHCGYKTIDILMQQKHMNLQKKFGQNVFFLFFF